MELGYCNSFLHCGSKTTTKIYEETIFKLVVKPINNTLFKGQHWIFQEDLAPAHEPKCCQEWLSTNIPAFIQAEEWTSGIPDLNPLDYELWDILEQSACQKLHPNLGSLKRSIIKKATKIPLKIVQKFIVKMFKRVLLCIDNEG